MRGAREALTKEQQESQDQEFPRGVHTVSKEYTYKEMAPGDVMALQERIDNEMAVDEPVEADGE